MIAGVFCFNGTLKFTILPYIKVYNSGVLFEKPKPFPIEYITNWNSALYCILLHFLNPLIGSNLLLIKGSNNEI